MTRTPFAERTTDEVVNAEWLVSPETGIVTSLTSAVLPDDVPAQYLCTVAAVADMRYGGPWLSDRIAAGTSFNDPAAARIAAIGEAVERYCGNFIPGDLPVASSQELTARGVRHLPPACFPSWSDEQYARPRFPYERFTEATRVPWAQGVTWDGEPCMAPASWTYLNMFHGVYRDAPRVNHIPYTGIATGTSVADAARRALTECVERDAFVTWWMLRLPAQPLRWQSVPKLVEVFNGSALSLRLLHVPSDMGLPTVAALVWDEQRQVPAAGFSCHESAEHAAVKAALEALQVWCASVGLVERDGPSWRAVDAGVFSAAVYFPFRQDRRYADDAGDRFRNVRDLAAQTQVWLDPRMHGLLERFDGVGEPVDVGSVPPGDTDAVVGQLGERNVCVVDLTTPDVREVGLRTVRCLAPMLQPNVPAALPYLGSTRLRDVARRHFGPDAVVDENTVELAPPPHN